LYPPVPAEEEKSNPLGSARRTILLFSFYDLLFVIDDLVRMDFLFSGKNACLNNGTELKCNFR
jgi:hypothetical protein